MVRKREKKRMERTRKSRTDEILGFFQIYEKVTQDKWKDHLENKHVRRKWRKRLRNKDELNEMRGT